MQPATCKNVKGCACIYLLLRLLILSSCNSSNGTEIGLQPRIVYFIRHDCWLRAAQLAKGVNPRNLHSRIAMHHTCAVAGSAPSRGGTSMPEVSPSANTRLCLRTRSVLSVSAAPLLFKSNGNCTVEREFNNRNLGLRDTANGVNGTWNTSTMDACALTRAD